MERKTLKELGVDRLDFAPGVPRERIVPNRLNVQSKLLEEELERKLEKLLCYFSLTSKRQA